MDKEVAYIYKGILFSYEKEGMLPFATMWMDLEGIMPNKSEKTTV